MLGGVAGNPLHLPTGKGPEQVCVTPFLDLLPFWQKGLHQGSNLHWSPRDLGSSPASGTCWQVIFHLSSLCGRQLQGLCLLICGRSPRGLARISAPVQFLAHPPHKGHAPWVPPEPAFSVHCPKSHSCGPSLPWMPSAPPWVPTVLTQGLLLRRR